MFKDMLSLKRKRPRQSKPVKEKKLKAVSAKRFNDMIDYYTRELKMRISEIQRLKHENEMLIKTSIRNAARSDQHSEEAKKLREEVRILQSRVRRG